MELFEQYKQKYQNVVDKYYFQANQTEKYWIRDNLAALKIQSKFKMYVKRKEFLKMKKAAIKIETAFRAFSARNKFQVRKVQETQRRNLHYFSNQALIIQKNFRGFYIRKYVHNFYKRKQQLLALKKKNQDFKKQLDIYAKQQQIFQKNRKQQLAKAEFTELARNLHHLSSTRNIPGVYNSPFAMTKPAAFNIPVQSHLKDVFNKSYKWKAPTKTQILKYSIKKS